MFQRPVDKETTGTNLFKGLEEFFTVANNLVNKSELQDADKIQSFFGICRGWPRRQGQSLVIIRQEQGGPEPSHSVLGYIRLRQEAPQDT
jgi:hypothetical protein